MIQPINKSAHVTRLQIPASPWLRQFRFSLPLSPLFFLSPTQKMSSPNSDPAYNNNPLPYPDRRRPGHSQQQQQPYDNMGQAESTTSGPPTAAGGGGLPYPDRPARYQDYSKT